MALSAGRAVLRTAATRPCVVGSNGGGANAANAAAAASAAARARARSAVVVTAQPKPAVKDVPTGEWS